jgi:crotonobetainyl-CoA:carnitine CoA-transferase CaiB-like acyl-CoA transferase
MDPAGTAPNAPLADLTILAVEQYGAGPWGTMQLADLGADVIKVEDPASGGDVGRYVPPFSDGRSSLFFESFNRGKRSIALDLRTSAGRRAFGELVERADAVVYNLRGDGGAKLGLTYETLGRRNPRIVCCSLSGFGQTGPRAAEPAYDYVLQALAGWMSLAGEPGGPPAKTGLSMVDFCGGYVLALGLLGAVWRARRDGVGADVDVSLFETAVSLLNYVGTWTATAGYRPQRLAESAHPSIVPFQAFRTEDGWITVACAKQHFWEKLCREIGRADLLRDELFADLESRHANREALLAVLRATFASDSSAAWVARLSRAGVPVGEVRDVAGALEEPQLQARGGLLEYEHPTLGTVRQPPSPLRISDHPRREQRGPLLGESTHALLQERCGWSDADIRRAEAEGAFGEQPAPVD